MNCPRCQAWIADDVVHLEDTPDGLYAVTSEAVADHIVECRCGCDIAITSTQAVTHHPGQLRLVPSEAA